LEKKKGKYKKNTGLFCVAKNIHVGSWKKDEEITRGGDYNVTPTK